MRYLALDLEVGKRNERIHALAAVDADGVGTLDEAKERLAKIEKRHRGPLVRIVERLINAPIDEGVSTDELMALSALSRDGVRNALHDLEQLGIANNDTTLATYIHEGCRTLVGATCSLAARGPRDDPRQHCRAGSVAPSSWHLDNIPNPRRQTSSGAEFRLMSVWDQTQHPAKMTISYNGIALPGEWPPSHIGVGDDPLPVPYLSSPPPVVPVDVGRQLFVDDFLIERTTLKRVYHAAKVHEAAPVLSPETELELNRGQCPVAAPFNDGAWYDPADGTFKLFYQAGWYDGVAMATSDDGINWRRPRLAAVRGTNAVIPRPPGHLRDGVLVWLDHEAAPEERFKMFVYWRWVGHSKGGKVYTSPDGIRWAERGMTSPSGDNTTFFHNPFRRKFVFSIRHKWQRRARSYHEHDDFLRASRWRDDDPVRWARADRLDRPDPLVGIAPQLYDLNAVAYESLMLGAFAIFHGPENDRAAQLGRPKINDLQLAYSRDGFHWHRPHREAFIGASRQWGSWNYGYVHAAGGVCLVVGDELWFYYGAFSGQGSIFKPGEFGDYPHDNAMYAGGHTGLATLRRDGFASMETDGKGELVTRPLKFSGKCLFVNIDAAHGELRVEVADRRGIVIEPFSLANCRPLRADSTRKRVEWNGGDLAALAGREVRFRFHLARGRLYAFWVSPSDRGVSRGFVAAGGPGYSGPVDE